MHHLGWTGAGSLLVATGITALMVAVENVGDGAIEVPFVAGVVVLAVVLLTVAVVHLLRASAPLLDLHILRITSFRVTAAGGSVYRMVIIAIPFLLPLMFQLGFGWNAAQAGLVIIALFAGNVGIKPVTTPLMRRFGLRTVLLAAIPASVVCLLGIAALTPSTPLPLLIALLALSGVFRSIGFWPTTAWRSPTSKPGCMTPANTLMTTLQELGGGLGVAVGALLLRLGEPVSAALGLADNATSPYRVAFVLLAVLLLVPLAEVVGLSRSAGAGWSPAGNDRHDGLPIGSPSPRRVDRAHDRSRRTQPRSGRARPRAHRQRVEGRPCGPRDPGRARGDPPLAGAHRRHGHAPALEEIGAALAELRGEMESDAPDDGVITDLMRRLSTMTLTAAADQPAGNLRSRLEELGHLLGEGAAEVG